MRTKRIIRAIYAFRCGYCGVTEAEVGSELTFDHFRPQSQAGSDDAANLVYACHACNEFKGEYWSENADTRLLHPLTNDLKEHIAGETNGTLRPLTALGQIYLDRLQLNRLALVAHRLERHRLLQVEDRLAEMTVTLRAILSAIEKKQM